MDMARNSDVGLTSIFVPHTKVVLFIIFLHIIGALAQVMAVSILRPLLQEGVYGGELSDIMGLGILLLVLTGIASVILAVTSYLASKVASAISSSLRMQIMEAALEAEDAGSIGNNTTVTMTCLTNDVAAIERYAFETLRTYLPMPFLFAFIIAFTSWINVTIGVIMMTILIVVGIVTYLFSKRLFPLFGQQIEAMDDVNALFRQKIPGARTIRAYNGYEYEKSKFSVASDKFGKLNSKIALNSYYIPNLSTAIMWMFIVFIFIDSALEGMGAIVPADIIVFMQFATYLVASLSIIPYFSIQSPRAGVCFERIRQIIDAAQEPRAVGGPSPDADDWSGPIFEV
jgi:ATP-binding cassette subfamily B protein